MLQVAIDLHVHVYTYSRSITEHTLYMHAHECNIGMVNHAPLQEITILTHTPCTTIHAVIIWHLIKWIQALLEQITPPTDCAKMALTCRGPQQVGIDRWSWNEGQPWPSLSLYSSAGGTRDVKSPIYTARCTGALASRESIRKWRGTLFPETSPDTKRGGASTQIDTTPMELWNTDGCYPTSQGRRNYCYVKAFTISAYT